MTQSRAAALLFITMTVALAWPAALTAQPAGTSISVTNLMEAQSGNTPFTPPTNRFGFYDQLNLDVTTGEVRLGLRFEADHSSEDQFTYDEITQRFAEWAGPRIRVRVGNFYTILGRGLIHRSFELPGVVLDQPGLRSRYGPSRDVDGVLLEGSAGPFRAIGFSGAPNGGDVSPGLEPEGLERYVGQVSGLELSATPWPNARLGTAYTRVGTASNQRELGTAFIDVDPLLLAGVGGLQLPLYLEYARENATAGEWTSFSTADSVPHALYAGANLIRGAFTLSAEWKDYAGFRLGTNDPPSLVKEHSWQLLNRATHVLNATLEQGFQVEGSWSLPDWGDVTVNRSRSDGRFATGPVRFEETYVELHLAPAGWPVETTLFHDAGKDEFSFLPRRRAAGGLGRVHLTDDLSVEAQVERQSSRRASENFVDLFASISVARAGLGTLAFAWERTTDPQEEDPAKAETPPVDPRHFLSGTLSAPLSDRHEIVLFAGQRRGGRACTAGTCYEVLSFKGVELRLTSRL